MSRGLLEAGSALVLGTALYMLARPPDLVAFEWVDGAGGATWLRAVRSTVAPAVALLPAFSIYSLPDGLWAYAFTATMVHLWSARWTTESRPWILLGPCAAIGSEIGQLLGLVPGTFDAVDLAFVVMGSVLPLRRLLDPRPPLEVVLRRFSRFSRWRVANEGQGSRDVFRVGVRALRARGRKRQEEHQPR